MESKGISKKNPIGKATVLQERVNFTGETCIPGVTPKKIEDDHIERYRFASQFVKGKSVLDIACGVGYGSKILAQSGAATVTAIDSSKKLIAYAEKNYKMNNINFQIGDIHTYKATVPYDIIVCLETIEHVKDYNKALSNLYSLLCNDGLLIISSPNRLLISPEAKSIESKPSNKFHLCEFTIQELRLILEKHGFKINDSDIFGQRQQIYFRNKYLRKIYKAFFNPDSLCSPTVTRIHKKMPRYFTIVAKKDK